MYINILFLLTFTTYYSTRGVTLIMQKRLNELRDMVPDRVTLLTGNLLRAHKFYHYFIFKLNMFNFNVQSYEINFRFETFDASQL